MALPKPDDLLTQIQAAAGPAGLRDLPPIAIWARVLDEYDPADPASLHSRSMTVEAGPDPRVAALLSTSGARQRGRWSFSVGMSEDNFRAAPIARLLDSAAPGALVSARAIINERTPRAMTTHRICGSRANDIDNHAMIGRAAALMTSERRNRIARAAREMRDNTNPYRGGIALSESNGVFWIQFFTDHFDMPEEALEAGAAETTVLNNRPLIPNRAPVDPKPIYPAEAFAVLDWAHRNGLMVVDPDEGTRIGTIRRTLASSVSVWPRPGRPAQARLAVGQLAWPALTTATPGDRTTCPGTVNVFDVDSKGVADITKVAVTAGIPASVAPGVADVARLAVAEPVDDNRLRDHQKHVVGCHDVTDLGFVNACAVGLGKTIMTYGGAALRAARTPGHRMLVVAEANVRTQWKSEATLWHPEATAISVTSRSEAARLAQTLRDAGDDPVVVITSYSLINDVLSWTNTLDLAEAGSVVADEDGDAEMVDTVPVAGNIPAPVAVTVPNDADNVLDSGNIDTGQLDLFSLLSDAPSNSPDETIENNDSTGRGDAADDDAPVRPLGQILAETFWHDLVADEAVTLKNPGSQQTRALWELRSRAGAAFALTGTPVDKSLDDLGRMIAWCRNDADMFTGHSLEKSFDLTDTDSLDDFVSAIGPLAVRYDQSEIADELPSFVPHVERVQLSIPERQLSNAARNELKKHYETLMGLLEAEMAAEADGDAGALGALRDQLRTAKGACLGGTTLARTAAADPQSIRNSSSAGAALLAMNGYVDAACEEGGSKRRRAVELVTELVADGEKVLMFTDFPSAAQAIIADLGRNNVRVGSVTGGNIRRRDEHIAAFQRGELDALILTAAGEKGLNLQQATAVIHYDLPWMPKSVIQRTGRAARIGAGAKQVKLYFMIAEDTVEERIAGVVVARAVKAMQALDAHRDVNLSDTEFGRMLGPLIDEIDELELNDKETELLAMTRIALAA